MRFALIGAGEIAVATAKLLIEREHEVIIIEKDLDRIEALSDHLDCGFLHGDGSLPEILEEVDPEGTDALFCLGGSDQDSLIAGLVGRSLGFDRVIVRIHNPDYAQICRELGLNDVIIPSQTIGRFLADMAYGLDVLELHSVLKDKARVFTFIAEDDDAGEVAGLDLPDKARVVCFYRGGDFHLADADSRLEPGDEIVILAHSDVLTDLTERWPPKSLENGDGD